MEEKNVIVLALYKVTATDWPRGEYSAAENQNAAIENVCRLHMETDPRTCSVQYIGEVYVPEQWQYITELKEEKNDES